MKLLVSLAVGASAVSLRSRVRQLSAEPQPLISADRLTELNVQAYNAAADAVQKSLTPLTGSHCGGCVRNYSVGCPEGWQQNGATCSPGSGYAGLCNKDQEWPLFSAVEKAVAEDQCKVCYPCGYASESTGAAVAASASGSAPRSPFAA